MLNKNFINAKFVLTEYKVQHKYPYEDDFKIRMEKTSNN